MTDRRMATRPKLTASSTSAARYRASEFERDLEVVLTGSVQRYEKLSIASLCPDYPTGAMMYSEPGAAFTGLQNQLWFLCCLFTTRLAEVSSRRMRRPSQQTNQPPKMQLVGLLASYWDEMHPGLLLLVLSLYSLPRPVSRISRGLAELMDLEVRLLYSRHGSEAEDIVRDMASEMDASAFRDSLTAFLPYGAEYPWQHRTEIVEKLRQSALNRLNDTSAQWQETGFLRIPSQLLVPSEIPSRGDSWDMIQRFALTFDGYKHCGSFERCAEIANAKRPRTLDEFRTCLFFEQRRWRHVGYDPDHAAMSYIRELVEGIRTHVET